MGVSMNILNILSDGRAERAIMDFAPKYTGVINKERILHCYGVAELMYDSYDSFDCKYLDKEQIYVLGLLHDIGYLNGKENHEVYGAGIFSNLMSMDNMIPHCIQWHGTTPKEYMDIHNFSPEDIPDELILLWWADLVIESSGKKAGKPVGFQKRLDGLAERYGEDSEPYRISKETIEWLCNNIALKFLTNKFN